MPIGAIPQPLCTVSAPMSGPNPAADTDGNGGKITGFRRTRHPDLSFIPAHPSSRLILHPGAPVIPTYPPSRRTRHPGVPVIPAHPSSRRTRHSGAPVIPAYPSFRRILHPDLSFIPAYPSFRRKPESNGRGDKPILIGHHIPDCEAGRMPKTAARWYLLVNWQHALDVWTFYPSSQRQPESSPSRQPPRKQLERVDILPVIPAPAGIQPFCRHFRPYQLPNSPPKIGDETAPGSCGIPLSDFAPTP